MDLYLSSPFLLLNAFPSTTRYMKVISFVSFTPLAPYYAGESVEIDSLSDFFSGFMEEIEMFEDRYFIAEPNGIADRVLTKMERAGGKILEALSAIDPFCKTVVPAQLVLNGQLKGFSILPCDPALKSMWIDELARDYAALKTEVSARTLDSKIAVVAPLVSPNSPFTYSPTIVPALRACSRSFNGKLIQGILTNGGIHEAPIPERR